MAGFVDTVERAILDHFVGNATWTPPATIYVGLSSTTPTEAGVNITEPSAGAYARVATTAATWDAATGTAPATMSNGAVITFPTATETWLSGADLTHFVLFDAATLGNAVAFGALATAKPVMSGDTASFAVGTLVLKLGDPTDTYT
jgi:hypothetical protein